MPTIRIEVSASVWPAVLAALDAAAGPIPPDVNPLQWAERVAAEWFATEVAAIVDPTPAAPEPVKPARRIRPSRVRI